MTAYTKERPFITLDEVYGFYYGYDLVKAFDALLNVNLDAVGMDHNDDLTMVQISCQFVDEIPANLLALNPGESNEDTDVYLELVGTPLANTMVFKAYMNFILENKEERVELPGIKVTYGLKTKIFLY